MRTRLTAIAATAVAAAIGVGATSLASCGVPLDSKPRAITRTTLASESIPPTTSASPTAQEVSVYFLNDKHLQEVRYGVNGQPTVDAALNFVLAGPAKGSPSG